MDARAARDYRRGPMPDVVFRPEQPQEAAAFDRLFLRAFGPGRFAKSSERVRERTTIDRLLSVGAWSADRLAGAARQSRIRVGEAAGTFLGPFAVGAEHRRDGLGRRLIAHACERAAGAGLEFVLLIGPAPYFAPLGFEAAEPGAIRLSGPVDPARLLLRRLRDGAGPEGLVTAAA